MAFLEPAPPRVLAHRGLAIDAPENTLLAFARAMAVGATHIETDVHASHDGHAVVAHDDTLKRVAGREVRVDHLSMAELRRVDLGHGQGFASLGEALDGFPDARFNIDIKSEAAIAPTVAAILDANATSRVLVTSFSEKRRLAALAMLPGVATSTGAGASATLFATSTFRLARRARKVLATVDAVQLPERYKGMRIVTPRLIRMAHDAGVEVHVWTVNDPADMSRLLDLGVDGIVTDRADLAIPLLAARQ
ncbi:glycerophosphodiester phosphodiesterase [Cryobacterium sp. BB307]|uniref:glycerophosphodiester phosphodiesterase family protein n=1 Tax=Cryobacterium sp. BB307 TaxID=2716317 RepID=UPI0014478801